MVDSVVISSLYTPLHRDYFVTVYWSFQRMALWPHNDRKKT